jgi:importin-7
MDVEQLYQVLQQSFSPDANVRNPATETIKNLKSLPGATLMLLHVVAEKQARDSFLLFVCCWLVGMCWRGWFPSCRCGR